MDLNKKSIRNRRIEKHNKEIISIINHISIYNNDKLRLPMNICQEIIKKTLSSRVTYINKSNLVILIRYIITNIIITSK